MTAIDAVTIPGLRLRPDRDETSLAALVRDTWIQTLRLLMRWSRDPLTVAQSVVFPALLVFVLDTVLSKQIGSFAGHDAVYGFVPLGALVGVMSGSVAGAIVLGRERDAGLLARMWVLPVHRASGLLSRLIAEGVRIVVGTAVIVIVGYALGFRFTQGVPAAISFFLVVLLFGIAFATMITAFAVFTAKATLVEAVSLVSSLLMFFSTGLVPLFGFPSWARPIVEQQPLTRAVDSMIGLSLGGPVQTPLIATIIWSASFIVVFAIPAAIGYRRASRR